MKIKMNRALRWGIGSLVVLVSLLLVFYLGRKSPTNYTCRIVAVYPLGPHDKGYGKVRTLMKEKLEELGYQAEMKEVYLQCGHVSDVESTAILEESLQEVEGWNPDLILVKGDQALEYVLRSSHKLLYTKPVIFHNVHFIDEESLRGRPNFSGYWDKLEYWKNMLFMKRLLGDVLIDVNYSRSRMGQLRHKWLMTDLEGKKVDIRMASMKREDYEDSTYLDSATVVRYCQDAEIRLNVVPIPNMTGKGLIDHFESHRRNDNMAFLIGKFEYSTHIVANYYHRPLFTTLSEGFNEDMRIVGGYFTGEQTLVDEWAGLVAKTLKTGHYLKQVVIKSEKAYHVDYPMMSFWNIDMDRLPSDTQVYNMPLYVRLNRLLIVSLFILIMLLLYGLYYLGFVRRKTRRERIRAAAVQRNVDAILYSLEQGHIISWHIEEEGMIRLDPSHRKFSGLEKDEFSYTEFVQLLFEEDRERMLHRLQHIFEDSAQRIEVRFMEERGPVWFALTYSIIDNQNDNGKVVCGIMENIEGRKQQERELIESRKMAEAAEKKQSFLENVNHEIRTPLNVIVGFSSIICNDVDNELDEHVKKEYVEAINSNNERLLALIRDILEISRIDSGYMQFHRERVSLIDFLHSVEQEKRGLIPQDVRFVVVKEGLDHVELEVDRMRLMQAFHCLLSNAGKFTKEGTIAINSWVDQVSREVCIAVSDTGLGISPQQLRMVFNRFYKGDTFAPGTGLGLSICELIVKQMNGRIEAKSTEGEGSTFTLALPLAE